MIVTVLDKYGSRKVHKHASWDLALIESEIHCRIYGSDAFQYLEQNFSFCFFDDFKNRTFDDMILKYLRYELILDSWLCASCVIARVGLTLKGENTPERVKYIMQPYRYLTLPKVCIVLHRYALPVNSLVKQHLRTICDVICFMRHIICMYQRWTRKINSSYSWLKAKRRQLFKMLPSLIVQRAVSRERQLPHRN